MSAILFVRPLSSLSERDAGPCVVASTVPAGELAPLTSTLLDSIGVLVGIIA